jgi:pyridoxal phosphate enzyme (YggS family)
LQSVTQITDHLGELRERVRVVVERSGRAADEIMILAVSKQQPAALIEAAYHAGQIHFGENYVQEALSKMQQLRHLPIQWHFIGRIQANKTRAIAEHFQWVHTLDRHAAAQRLNSQRPHYAEPLNVLIQVNQANEPQKAGVAPAESGILARAILAMPRLKLRGLMSLPPAGGSPEQSRPLFRELRELRDQLVSEGIALDVLSMGMSADFEIAIAEGATCVRIGTALFGPRS